MTHDWFHLAVAANWDRVAVHVVQSTVIALALLALSLFPRLESRTRHALLLVALAKFFVPLSLIARLLALIGIDVSKLPLTPATPAAGGWIAIAFSGGETVATPVASEIHCLLVAGWMLIATTLFVRWGLSIMRVLILRSRLDAPLDRDVAVLESLALGARPRRVRLARSGLVTSPCVAGVFRPVIILPSTVELLDDEQLRMLLAHELAHVRRRDPLLLNLQAIAAAFLWFHPLVWILTRSIRVASESACDEVVLSSGVESDEYLEAMLKTCRLPSRGALELPAMAESHLGERMKTMSMFSTRFQSPAIHALVLSLSLLAIIAAALVLAAPHNAAAQTVSTPTTHSEPLSGGLVTTAERIIFAKVGKLSDGSLNAAIDVRDRKSGTTLITRAITTRPGEKAEFVNGWAEPDGRSGEVRVEFLADASGLGVVWCRFFADGALSDDLRVPLVPRGAVGGRAVEGEPIDLSLKDADLAQTLSVFGQLTGLRIDLPAGISGSVTIDLHATPWPVAIDRMLDGSGYTWRREGDSIVIERK